MSLGKHAAGRRPLGKLALLLALAMVVSAFAVGPLAGAVEANAAYVSHTGDIYVPTALNDGAILAAVAAPDDGQFVQMGPNSSIILMFPGALYAMPDGSGAADLTVDIIDTLYPAYAQVSISFDGSTYTPVGFFADTANIDLDLEAVGPVKYVKIEQPLDCDPGYDETNAGPCIDPAYPLLGFDLDGVVALNAGDPTFGDPEKVWVCHFEGHEAGGVFFNSGSGEDLDGDYVLTFMDEPVFPTERQTTFCEDPAASGKLLPVAGNLILVSVHAVENEVKGHRVQNLLRGISSYPDGYKG